MEERHKLTSFTMTDENDLHKSVFFVFWLLRDLRSNMEWSEYIVQSSVSLFEGAKYCDPFVLRVIWD